MRKLRTFQDLGHEVTFLIGNFTGLVGDPSDSDKTRPMLTPEQLAANAETYADQAFRILDRERTAIRSNADWLRELGFADVVRLASNFTVAQFLERDNFARRWERHDAIHVSEFMYALMQAYDAVALETDVQVGGTDQLFNLMAGRVLQREHGQRPQIVITLPILVGTDGQLKMSKSTGNYIGIDEPPNELYGKLMSIPDDAMRAYFTLLTDLAPAEVDALLASVEGGPASAIDAKKRARARGHGRALHARRGREQAQRYFEGTFQRRETPDEMIEFALPADGHGVASEERLDRVLVAANVVESGRRGAAPRQAGRRARQRRPHRGVRPRRAARRRDPCGPAPLPALSLRRQCASGARLMLDGGFELDIEAVCETSPRPRSSRFTSRSYARRCSSTRARRSASGRWCASCRWRAAPPIASSRCSGCGPSFPSPSRSR